MPNDSRGGRTRTLNGAKSAARASIAYVLDSLKYDEKKGHNVFSMLHALGWRSKVVLLAVFVPTSFMPGLVGVMYKQFGLTISAATVLAVAVLV